MVCKRLYESVSKWDPSVFIWDNENNLGVKYTHVAVLLFTGS